MARDRPDGLGARDDALTVVAIGPSIARSWTWIAIAASGYGLFLAILGLGVGPLAGVGFGG
jgi:hypothetical protein